LTLLEARLAEAPEDGDARTLYGIVLSWDARYDDARRELRRVIEEDPANLDARLALVRVEIWANRGDAAGALIAESLERFPGDAELLALRNQIRRNPPARETRAGVALDEPEPGDAWREIFASVSLPTSFGPLIARAGRAERGGDEGIEIAADAYPRIDPKTYVWLQASIADDSTVYPDWRLGAEVYRTFARAWEGSVGYRRLEFDDPADVLTASIGRYVGSWLIFHAASSPRTTARCRSGRDAIPMTGGSSWDSGSRTARRGSRSASRAIWRRSKRRRSRSNRGSSSRSGGWGTSPPGTAAARTARPTGSSRRRRWACGSREPVHRSRSIVA
ncbi:MAG TPA: YaiO family outer membrane beta-barrel protein, partial [Thermoanaerobaculia bacterium]|nr:YaiO family outer membrane beta-barrel protein [Thermoanaerobaculia bacterium]